MSITICTVSGTVRDPSGAALVGATIKAKLVRPFIHPTDNSLIVPYEVTTTSATDGTWSLSLAETTTPAVSITISIQYLLGSNSITAVKDYAVIIPNSASATFASLVTNADTQV